MGQPDSSLTDRSGSGKNGTLYGTKLIMAPGGGQARNFNGTSDYVNATDSAGLSPSSGLTVEALFRADSLSGVQTLASKSWSGGTGEGYTLWLNGNRAQMIIYDKNGVKVNLYSPTLATDTWYHVAATFDGSIMSMYVNGVNVTSCACNGMKASTLYLLVGRTAPKSEGFLNGDLAMIRVYGRALSAGEVITNYNADCARAGLPPL
jgi:hypothetical protein